MYCSNSFVFVLVVSINFLTQVVQGLQHATMVGNIREQLAMSMPATITIVQNQKRRKMGMANCSLPIPSCFVGMIIVGSLSRRKHLTRVHGPITY